MVRQWRTRWFWLTITTEGYDPLTSQVTLWLCIGGRKPLAHLPWWRRLLHPPAIRWRLL